VAQSWFKRFQFGNFEIKDAPRSGQPITGKVDEIIKKVEQDQHISSHDIGKELNIDHKTVLNYLEKDKKKLEENLVSHDLTVKNLMDQISICESFLKRNEIEPLLKQFITSNEKWILSRMTIMYKKDHGQSKVKLRKWWQRD